MPRRSEAAASLGVLRGQLLRLNQRLKLLLSLLLDLGYLLAALVSLPWLVYRLASRRDFGGFLSRLGFGLGTEASSPIWLHGASAGEVLMLQPLVCRIERDLPETRIVISAFSSTGLAAARGAFPRHRVVPFPFDLSVVAHRFLRRLQPRLVVIVEGDLWANFLLALRRRRIPVVVLNGRMSPRSCRWHELTRIVPSLMRSMPLIAVQTKEHARRLRDLGMEAKRLHVTGNMKYDLAPPPFNSKEVPVLRARLGYRSGDIVIIGGSLHPGEDAALLRAYSRASGEARRPIALVLVPRYPSDAARVETNAREFGFAAQRKTAVDTGSGAPGANGVLIVDTLGELRALYAVADIAFVGGSLSSRGRYRGGHNLMEPAIAGVPVLFGPHHSSFFETAAALVESGGGAEVRTWEELARHVIRLADNDTERCHMGERARAAIASRQGATEENYALLRPLLVSEDERASGPGLGTVAAGSSATQGTR